jgi:hypothetical protein
MFLTKSRNHSAEIKKLSQECAELKQEMLAIKRKRLRCENENEFPGPYVTFHK